MILRKVLASSALKAKGDNLHNYDLKENKSNFMPGYERRDSNNNDDLQDSSQRLKSAAHFGALESKSSTSLYNSDIFAKSQRSSRIFQRRSID